MLSAVLLFWFASGAEPNRLRLCLDRLPRPPVKGRSRSSPLTVGLMRQAVSVRVAQAAPASRFAAGKLTGAPMTAHSQTLQLIPLNKLVASPRNVRRTDRKADIDALAASIAAHGLLQNLCVVPGENDRFEVDAGGRRLLALKQLARTGAIPKNHPVPCHVIEIADGREVSLIENVQRVSMDAMDEVEAYGALIADGMTPDDVARRFGVTRRHVDQRLALSGLSPKIKAAWKRGDVSLEAARAFCLVEDHARQEAVFRSLGRPVTHAGSVRARLMEGTMRASDRLAQFVGLEAYELAGGAIVRDLFDADAVYVGDPALMTQLAEQKLEAAGEAWRAEGWGWVEVSLSQTRGEGSYAARRLQPDWRALTDAEEAELARLRADLATLDAALDEDSVEDDPRWEARDDLAAAIETLRQSARVWDADLIAHAGVVLSIGHDGEFHAAPGIVRRSDEKAVKAISRKKAAMQEAEEGDLSGSENHPGIDADPDAPTLGNDSPLPKSLIRDLSTARTRAIRLLLAQNREVALAVAVAAMLVRSVCRSDLGGIGVAAHPAAFDDLEALVETRGALLAYVPEREGDVLEWCLAQPSGTLLALLAVLVADAVDLVHEKGAPCDHRRQALADQLAEALDLDMRAYWQADDSYWARLPKGELLAVLAEAPSLINKRETARAAMLKAHAKLKKDELAAKVGAAFKGTGYLPELLVTPISKGGVELTDAAIAAIAAE
jgi:ParB family chromosome partitioning protein